MKGNCSFPKPLSIFQNVDNTKNIITKKYCSTKTFLNLLPIQKNRQMAVIPDTIVLLIPQRNQGRKDNNIRNNTVTTITGNVEELVLTAVLEYIGKLRINQWKNYNCIL